VSDADDGRQEDELVASFLLLVDFELDGDSETPTADTILRITEAWDLVQRRFGLKHVKLVSAGVHMFGQPDGETIVIKSFPGNESLMKPAWEELKHQRFALEKHGVVENSSKPGTPTHAEFQVWAPVIEELLVKDPAGRHRVLKMGKWAPKFNAALRERDQVLFVERGNAGSRRFLNVVRAVFEDPEVVFSDGSNLYTTLTWRSDLPPAG
jgi:hypothetical protein